MHGNDEIRKAFTYDPETGLVKWSSRHGHSGRVKSDLVAGCPNARGYLVVNFNRTGYYAHRLAWFLYYGEWPSGLIDHINGDRMDNRISNLRSVTAKDNANNRNTKYSYMYSRTNHG